MNEELDQTIKTLADASAGWVTRRDAALALGECARKSLAALQAHAHEKDVDVRYGVVEALNAAGAVAAPEGGRASVPAKPSPPTLKELAQACIRKSKRAVKPDGDGFVVRVQTKAGRKQDVRIDRCKPPGVREVIQVSTECGVADDRVVAWAIRSNGTLTYGAFCVEERDGREHLRIVSNFDPALATPEMVKNAVKEAAHYGDWLEKKLSGEDQH